ncbi:MAG: 4-aminobutyrate--2-oxoglutarate transaminase [Candidatus Diapherotrites archaeon]|nr:4-aminobutyrate--2-oxoglutarate transaminase [Candidatus Diapherotrites archaeon]
MGVIRIRTKIPGPKSTALIRVRNESVSHATFGAIPIFVKRAQGARVEDVDGNSFIDFTGGLGANNVGHCNPRVVKAVKAQADRVLHTDFSVTMYESYVRLARALCKAAPGKSEKKAMFFNSGAEAVENALKVARYNTGRPGIICLENAFHGRTNMLLTLTSKFYPYKKGFGPYAEEVYRLEFPDVYRRPEHLSEKEFVDYHIEQAKEFFVDNTSESNTACLVMEPVQGEGGFNIPPKKWVQFLYRHCRENGVLFISDEVQTGFGRTGKMWGIEHFEIEPDIVTMAKSIAGGLPLGAVVARKHLMDHVHVSGLGTTFGGNPLACAAGVAVLEEFRQKKLLRRAQEIGKITLKRFKEWEECSPIVGNARGIGAMNAIELVKDKESKEPNKEAVGKIIKYCYERGVLLLSAGMHGQVIRTLMPLVITREELAEGLDVLEEAVFRMGGKK